MPSPVPTPLYKVLWATFLGSVSGGAFWSASFFVTVNAFGFSPQRNLWLAAVMGVVYVIGAGGCGRLVRSLSAWLSTRAILIGSLLAWGAFASIPLMVAPHSETALWVATVGGSFTGSFVWPIMESYMSAGRHGAGMRQAIGRFNLTWTPAVAVPLLFMPWVAQWNVLACVSLSAVFNIAASFVVMTFPKHPAHHDETSSKAAVGGAYPQLARATLWLLPLSYVISSVLAPLLPSRLQSLGVSVSTAPMLAAMWMLTRFGTLALLWRWSFWHGRWGSLVYGASALLGGALLVLGAPWTWLCVVGLGLYGSGMAAIYFAALYYNLAVGQAKVDAGGTFEALVGVGYVLGPLLGLLGFASGGFMSPTLATLALCTLVAALMTIGPVKAYRRARASRRSLS